MRKSESWDRNTQRKVRTYAGRGDILTEQVNTENVTDFKYLG